MFKGSARTTLFLFLLVYFLFSGSISTAASDIFPGCQLKANEKDTQSCSASSVIMANGTYEFSERDLSVPARGMSIEWTRHYRSNRIVPALRSMLVQGGSGETTTGVVFAEPADGPMGFGWTNDYLSRIEGDAYIDGDGAHTFFAKDSAGNYLTDMENGLILKKTATGYELIEIGGRTLNFNASGRLLSIKDLSGNTVTLQYDGSGRLSSIRDATDRTVLTFTHNSGNRIETVTDHAGRTMRYEYDGAGNLIKVSSTQNSTPITQHLYSYNSNHGITSKANALGETVTITYKYPDKGIVEKIYDPVGTRMIQQGKQPTGHLMTYAYDFKNGTFYVTDFNGVKKKKVTNDKGRLLLEEEVQAGAEPRLIRKIEYLPNRTEKHTDSAGNITTIQRDEWRNIVKVTDGEGNVTSLSYNTWKQPQSVTDALGNVTRMEYDGQGNLTRLTQAQGKAEQMVTTYGYNGYGEVTTVTRAAATTSVTYNATGLPASILDPLNNSTTIEYDTYGNATAVTDPENRKTEFTYDTRGNLLTRKDPLGNITAYTYNADDRPMTITDALNRVTTIETDYKGRVTAVIDALTNRKEYGYDGNGNLIKAVSSELSAVSFTYDGSNRLKSVTDPEGYTTTYEYASASGSCSSCSGSTDSPVKITDPLGNFARYVYDKANRLASVVDPMGNVSLLGRDAGGRMKSRTDANGNLPTGQAGITTYEYDGLNRVRKQTDANNGVTSFTYDQYGNLKTLTDPNGNVTSFDYDLSGRMTKETRPMGQATEYTYYRNGLLKTVKDAKSQVTTYTYDAANRLKEIAYADGKKDSFTYDNVGNISGCQGIEIINLNA